MKLVDICDELLTEAKNPLSAFRNIFRTAGINFAEAEAALLLGLKQTDNTITSLSKATPEQIEKAFKTAAFKKYSQSIARIYIVNNDKTIEKIIKKYPINTPAGSKSARAEIGNTLGVNKSIASEIFTIKRPKKARVSTPTTTPGTNKKMTPGQAFLDGVKTVQAPFLASRYAFRNVPIPGLRAYIRNRTTKLTPEEMNRIRLWFFTGVGDAKSVYDIFKKNGIPTALVNLGGQVFSKWLFWSAAFSIVNLLLDVGKDIGKPVYESELEGWFIRIKRSPEGASLGWLFPVAIVFKQLIAPLGTGGIIPFHTKQFNDKLIELRNRAENETKKLESNAKNGIKKSKSIITPKPKNTTNQPKIDTTSQNVKTGNEGQPTNNQPTAVDNRPVIKY